MTFTNRLLLALLGMWVLAISAPSRAAESVITATFNPARIDPAQSAFIDTSRGGSYCAGYPARCDNRKSLQRPINTSGTRPLTANNPNPREGLTLKAPIGWHDVIVRHSGTGESRTVRLHLVALRFTVSVRPDIQIITGINDYRQAHNALWQDGLDAPPLGCALIHSDVIDVFGYSVTWEPTGPTFCSKQNLFNFTRLDISPIETTYELQTPNPLDMDTGTWSGSLMFNVGPGMDFDFGDNVLPKDPVFNIRIDLNVSHHLSIVFPPGADRLALEPEGGWMPWHLRGRRPELIYREQPFQFSSSVPVKMHIECQYLMADNCAIKNPAGHQVPVATQISLPAGMFLLTGKPVDRTLLSNWYMTNAVPATSVNNQIGKLRFEVARNYVEMMLKYPDTTYTGDVTVVWDAALIP